MTDEDPDVGTPADNDPAVEIAADQSNADEALVDETLLDAPPSGAALADAKRAIEAIVLVATDPIPDQLLAQVLELSIPAVRRLCGELAESYRVEDRGFQFVEVAGGWRYQTHPDMAPYIERYVLEGQTARLSSAALETLSIVAYKQPLSRAQMSAIRGVNVDGVLRTLVQKGYVAEIGRDVGPGQATLFGTTELFLERLGLASLGDLPPLGEFVPDASVVEALEMTLRVAPEEPQLPLDDGDQVEEDPLVPHYQNPHAEEAPVDVARVDDDEPQDDRLVDAHEDAS